jgi:hypothetical protein
MHRSPPCRRRDALLRDQENPARPHRLTPDDVPALRQDRSAESRALVAANPSLPASTALRLARDEIEVARPTLEESAIIGDEALAAPARQPRNLSRTPAPLFGPGIRRLQARLRRLIPPPSSCSAWLT